MEIVFHRNIFSNSCLINSSVSFLVSFYVYKLIRVELQMSNVRSFTPGIMYYIHRGHIFLLFLQYRKDMKKCCSIKKCGMSHMEKTESKGEEKQQFGLSESYRKGCCFVVPVSSEEVI